MNNSPTQECKAIPIHEAISSLNDSIQRAHNLFSNLHSRIDCAIVHQPTPEKNKENNCKVDTPHSDLTEQIKEINRMVEELCSRIIVDLENIEL